MTGSEQERRDFAVPAATGTYDDIDLAFLDRADENERRLLIEADRPTPTHETHAPPTNPAPTAPPPAATATDPHRPRSGPLGRRARGQSLSRNENR